MNYHFAQPEPVGYWRIGGVNGLRFAVYRRPRWLTRWLCAVLLEWEYVPERSSREDGPK